MSRPVIPANTSRGVRAYLTDLEIEAEQLRSENEALRAANYFSDFNNPQWWQIVPGPDKSELVGGRPLFTLSQTAAVQVVTLHPGDTLIVGRRKAT